MQKPHATILGFALAVLLAFSLLASTPAQSLTPPAGNTLLLSTFGNGIQVYHSQRVDGTLRWVFSAPSATLFTDKDEATPIATHYAGPSWQSVADGSTVAGKVVVTMPPSSPGSIPQLLLIAKSHRGAGLFGRVSFVQRLNTVGGIAPPAPPTDLGQEADVPYKATYNFYAPAAAK